MHKLIVATLALAAASLIASVSPGSAQGMTKQQALAQCKAQLGGAAAQRSREGGATAIANCVKQKMGKK
jgi:hypothetical protein